MLPLKTDFPPMEAHSLDELPNSPDWQFEPKWDGFRCLVFRDGDSVELKSKSGRVLERYFPEVAQHVLELKADKFVIDGEIVIPSKEGFSFDLLLQRVHPAESRIKKLAKETPGVLIVFDILVDETNDLLTEKPLRERRKILERFASEHFKNQKQITLSPASTDRSITEKWRQLFNNKLDGIVAKRLDASYDAGDRNAVVKVKWMRTADCVIGGFRYGKDKKTVGSLLLGLYDETGALNHVGFCSAFDAKTKKELTKLLEPLVAPPGFTGTAPGGPSRWNKGEEKEWMPVGGDLVAEFKYDHFSDGRFRHGTKLVRWRPDKKPEQCTMDQIK
ncbi:MAG TPA: ATP-dependent DNA ligase [Oculatellaceae cyanobacterium]